MDKFLIFLGGIIGGYALVLAPVAGSFLSGLGTLLDIVGAICMIFFGAALIVQSVRAWLMR
jgi:hypothetical protein